MSVKKLSQPLASNVADALLDTNKQSLVTSFDALLMHLKPLVKIGDEIAKVCSPVFFPCNDQNQSFFFRKIHPYVNFAWTVLSAGMKVS